MGYLGVRSDILLFFGTFLTTFLLYPAWINFVYKFHMGEVSRVHEHKQGIPTMGGFVFMLTVTVITILFNRSRSQTLLLIFISLTAGLLGLLEDFAKVYAKSGLPSYFKTVFVHFFGESSADTAKRKNFLLAPWYAFKEFSRAVGSSEGTGLDTSHKFILQGLMAGFLAYWVYFKLGWDYIWFPLIGNVHIGFLYPIFVFILFIGILNAVAFTDGLDGLAGGLSLFAFLAFWGISRALEYNSLAGFSASFVGALLPFLYFNVYPARIMMGNVGSHVLGAVLALLAIATHREVAFLFIGFMFILDGVSSPIQQFSVKLTKKRLFRMAPIHHHFEQLGWPETKVTLRFWVFGMAFAIFGLFISLL